MIHFKASSEIEPDANLMLISDVAAAGTIPEWPTQEN